MEAKISTETFGLAATFLVASGRVHLELTCKTEAFARSNLRNHTWPRMGPAPKSDFKQGQGNLYKTVGPSVNPNGRSQPIPRPRLTSTLTATLI